MNIFYLDTCSHILFLKHQISSCYHRQCILLPPFIPTAQENFCSTVMVSNVAVLRNVITNIAKPDQQLCTSIYSRLFKSPPPFHFPYSHLVDRLLPLTGSIIVSLCNNPIRRAYPQVFEVVHYIRMVVFNCYFQGSPLMGKHFCSTNKHWELAKVIF